MKKIVLLVVALVMCLTMSGLAENEPMEWVQTGDFWYVMSDEFYFQIPADWEEQTENGNQPRFQLSNIGIAIHKF